jgi:hypothetical protein
MMNRVDCQMADSATHKTRERACDPNPTNLPHINPNVITAKRNQSKAEDHFRQNMGNTPG